MHDEPRKSSGPIDIHSHLLPDIDDGCQSLDESIACVERLIAAGFAGTICTPHIWIDTFPENVPDRIRQQVQRLEQTLQDHGLDYQLWAGGEVRLFDGIVDWFKGAGVPTLAESRCVLVDFWEPKWPMWANGVFEWLLAEGYQPILAHPERMPATENLDANLAHLEQMGVWLQGNSICMTGEEGYHADHMVRKLLHEHRYQLIALDMHRLDSLDSRLDGLELIEMEFDRPTLDRLTIQAPRELILSTGVGTE